MSDLRDLGEFRAESVCVANSRSMAPAAVRNQPSSIYTGTLGGAASLFRGPASPCGSYSATGHQFDVTRSPPFEQRAAPGSAPFAVRHVSLAWVAGAVCSEVR
mmetsp:Transcript_1826/g.4122  ORF Transcript_1826/g.4122 Transcript_1826/m.4122 type:complete len:103 (+) Transcript_1826:24-332(+)